MLRRSKLLIGSAIAITLTTLALPSRRSDNTLDEPVAAPPPQEPLEAREIMAPPATQAQLAAQAARSDALAWGRDPFAPPAQPRAGLAELLEQAFDFVPPPAEALEPDSLVALVKPQLTGLSQRGSERWAIIDGEIVREGDALSSGHLVAKIESRSVTVYVDSQELTLELGGRP